jgi:hypothetical protein
LCRLTKSIDELADVVKTVINNDLAEGVPVLADIIRTANVIFKDPLKGIANIADVIKDVNTLGYMFNSTVEETQQILHDVSDILDTSINLITKLITSQG